MQTVLQVQIATHYGATHIYPVNQEAKLIADIAGTTTLTRQTLRKCADLGYTIEDVTPKANLLGVN